MADWTDQDSDWELAPASPTAGGHKPSSGREHPGGLDVRTVQASDAPAATWALAAAAASLALLVAWNVWRQRLFFHDDAFIELRYVRHLLTLGQPVWNPGEWVEGFTSVLHLLLVTGAAWLGQGHGLTLPDAAHAVNFTAFVLVLASGWGALSQVHPQHPWPRLAGMSVLAASAPLAIWSWGGLEAVLAAAWVGLGWWWWCRWARGEHPAEALRCWPVGLCMALAAATRPDTLLIPVGALLGELWLVRPIGLSRASVTEARPRLLRWAALALAILGPVMLTQTVILAARWSLYGDLAPNTFYAKVQGISVLHRLQTGAWYLLRTVPDVPALLVIPILLWRMRTALRDPWLVRACAGAGLFVLGLWWLGGDHMAAGRFLVPVLPLLAMCTARLWVRQAADPGARRWLWLLLAATLLSPLVRPGLKRDGAAWVGQLVGHHMASHWPAGSLVALNTAGAPAYFSPDLRFIDMLGLNDWHIARRTISTVNEPMQRLPGHAKGDGAYVLSREPDFIIAGYAEGQEVTQSSFFGDRELARSAEFRRCYRLQRSQINWDAEHARYGSYPTQPMPFTYYQRVCPTRSQAEALSQVFMKPRS